MSIIVNTQNYPHKISDHCFVYPIATYHGKFVSAFTKELPAKGKIGEVIKRIITVIVAPLAYLALGLLGLVGATLHGISCQSQSQSHIKYRELTYEPSSTFPIEAYKSVDEKLKRISDYPSLYLVNEENHSGQQRHACQLRQERLPLRRSGSRGCPFH